MNEIQAKQLKKSYESFLDQWIEKNFDQIPEELTTCDLVKMGMYQNMQCLKNANSKGKGPLYKKDNGFCVYSRSDVLTWFRSRALKLWKGKHD